MALDGLAADVWASYGGRATIRAHAARVEIEGITAHGVDAAGALRNWCGAVRRQMAAP